MVDHLMDKHGIQDKTEAKSKANEFLVRRGKVFWSCPFCVQLCDSLTDRLQHIDKHFKQSHSWDQSRLTNEISGLLRQPRLKEAWDSLVAFRNGRLQPHFMWQGATAERLLQKLQFGTTSVESAEALASEVYNAVSRILDPVESNLVHLQYNDSFSVSGERRPPLLGLDANAGTHSVKSSDCAEQGFDDLLYQFIDPRLLQD